MYFNKNPYPSDFFKKKNWGFSKGQKLHNRGILWGEFTADRWWIPFTKDQ